nr:hypothetical protein BACY1_08630 [Tenacibaculum mesophilum]
MKNLYLKIIEKFNQAETIERFTEKGLPYIKTIDLYAGQDYNEGAFEAHLFPALFVKWSIDYLQNPPSALLTFRVCWEQLRDTSNLNETPEEALRFIDFINLVDEVLKEIETENTSKFTLLSEELNIEDTITDTHSLNYRCSYTGKSKIAKTNYQAGAIDEVQEQGEIFTTVDVIS